MIKHTIKLGAATAISLSLMSGGVAFAGSSNTNHRDPGSKNANICIQSNKNNVFVGNLNVQSAKSGSATVGGGNSKNKWVKKDTDTGGNTTGGSATSGNAKNDNATTTTVTVSNATDPCSCPCDTTPVAGVQTDNQSNGSGGNSSLNLQVTSNTNNVFVVNASFQGAQSGNATVSGNTTGGSATSGNAANTNTTTQTVTVSNN